MISANYWDTPHSIRIMLIEMRRKLYNIQPNNKQQRSFSEFLRAHHKRSIFWDDDNRYTHASRNHCIFS